MSYLTGSAVRSSKGAETYSRIVSGFVVSFGMIGLFACSQLVFEVTLASVAATHVFEQYIAFRNHALIFATLSPLGFSNELARSLKPDEQQGLMIGSLGAIAITALLLTFSRATLPQTLAVVVLAMAQVTSAALRTNKNFFLAVVLRDGWRAGIWGGLLGLLASSPDLCQWIQWAFCIALLPVTALGFRRLRKIWPAHGVSLRIASITSYAVPCFWFSIINLSLFSANYLDQLLIERGGFEIGTLKNYALACTIVLSPFTLLSNTLAFILLPHFASRPATRGPHMRSRIYGMNPAFLGASCAVSLLVVSMLVLTRVEPNLFRFLGWSTIVALYIIAGSKLIYSVISSDVGAHARGQQLAFVAYFNLAMLVLQGCGCLILVRYFGVKGLAWGMALTWITRNAIGQLLRRTISSTRIAIAS